jgi:hypothetical protein
MPRQFIDEPIKPVAGTMDARGMARGEPGLPAEFTWRGRTYVVAEVLERWKTTGRCTSGSDELYVRKHWYRLRMTSGEEMRIYFERQPRSARERKARWWLFEMTAAGER